MELKYGLNIDKTIVANEFKKIINLTYKLLPSWEEHEDWRKLLNTIIEELVGMDEILITQHDLFFPIICKLEGLILYEKEEDFMSFRRTIFEILGLMGALKDKYV